MTIKEFNSLNIGNMVLCNNGDIGTVLETNIINTISGKKMIKLKCNIKRYFCPYFYRAELNYIVK